MSSSSAKKRAVSYDDEIDEAERSPTNPKKKRSKKKVDDDDDEVQIVKRKVNPAPIADIDESTKKFKTLPNEFIQSVAMMGDAKTHQALAMAYKPFAMYLRKSTANKSMSKNAHTVQYTFDGAIRSTRLPNGSAYGGSEGTPWKPWMVFRRNGQGESDTYYYDDSPTVTKPNTERTAQDEEDWKNIGKPDKRPIWRR